MKEFVLILLFLFASSDLLIGQEDSPQPNARLRAFIDKRELVLGESFTITVTYEVADDNTVPVQFIDAGVHVYKIIEKLQSNGYCSHSQISEIYGRRVERQGRPAATTYDLIKMQIWPRSIGSFEIPELEMPFMAFKNAFNADSSEFIRKDSTIINQKTFPITFKVTLSPHFEKMNELPLVGELKLEESTIPVTHRLGDEVPFSLTLSGPASIIFAQLNPMHTELAEVKVDFIDYRPVDEEDTSTLYQKKFNLRLIPKATGRLDLADVFKWKYLKDGANETSLLAPKTVLEFTPGKVPRSEALKNTLLAVDISESMQLQDYEPDRMGMAKKIIEAYRLAMPDQYAAAFSGGLVDISQIDSQDVSVRLTENRGTAIGNTLWLGVEMLKGTQGEKAIILICDGDNTTGIIDIGKGIEMAKKHGVRVFTIGLGHTGEILFGKDFYGRPNYVDNTFIDTSLKNIAAETGGQYFYVDDFKNPDDIIRSIAKEIGKR